MTPVTSIFAADNREERGMLCVLHANSPNIMFTKAENAMVHLDLV